MTGPFTRTRLVKRLRSMAEAKRVNQGFDISLGIYDVMPMPRSEATAELVHRAIQYGRWRMLESLADELESRDI